MAFSSEIDSLSPAERVEYGKGILNSALDAIVTIDTEQRIVEWNRAAEEIFGWRREDVLGRYMPEVLIPPALREAHARGLARYRETGDGPILNKRIELEALHANGSLLPVELAISPIQFRDTVYFTARLRDITDRHVQMARQQSLIHELNHRVKNVLAVVSAMLRFTAAPTVEEYRKIISARIEALASVHDEVARSEWTGANVAEIVAHQAQPFASTQLHARGPVAAINPTGAQAFGLVLHELFTNASKYGALSVPGGTIHLTWAWADRDLRVVWIERGGPRVVAPTRNNYGLTVITRFTGLVLENPAQMTWNPAGLECSMILPAKLLVYT